MGLMLAEPEFHTRCFVEWEQCPRDTLIAAQRAGHFSPAPIWDDVTTFDAKPLAGAIDTVLAGYPCQPFSAAGQRKGENDERHLWPDIERIIGELGPALRWCFFENVAGHLSLGLDTVLRSLRNMGFTTAAGLFSAEEVGATHERQRVFIVAYRKSPDGWGELEQGRAWRGRAGSARGCAELANTSMPGPQRREQRSTSGQRDGTKAPGSAAELCRPLLFPPGPSDSDLWASVIRSAPSLAPAVSKRDIKTAALNLTAILPADTARSIQSRALRFPKEDLIRTLEREASEVVAKSQAFAEFRGLAYGLASRSRALRLLGNGVVPLAAAYAWRTLSAAHGLGWVDLERADGCNRNPR